MFRIALCDDNKAFLEYERSIIEQHMSEKSLEVMCDFFLSGAELLAQQQLAQAYDLFILDYEMDGLTGFETASKIYEVSPQAKIAFATQYYDFTREGYKYRAIRYLVKQEDSFQTDLKECLECVLKADVNKKVILETSSSTIEVDVSDIAYIKSDKHYIEYFTIVRELNLHRRVNLDVAQEELPEQFERVHQRYIVNLNYATEVKRYSITLKLPERDTIDIPIARRRFEGVYDQFVFVKGGM